MLVAWGTGQPSRFAKASPPLEVESGGVHSRVQNALDAEYITLDTVENNEVAHA